jgi:5-(carboxyamino)imidazole ribonucleotide synthase
LQHRVGIVGAGQLARMMVQAAIPLGVEVTVLAASAEDGAAQVASRVMVGSPDDADRIRQLTEQVDVLTFDHELVDPDVLDALEHDGHAVHPRSKVMRLAQNKRLQREMISQAGLPGPSWLSIRDIADLDTFSREHGWPLVLKAVRGGYDGRGVWKVADYEEASSIFDEARANGTELLAEAFQKLDGEIAVIVARSQRGDCAVYSATETVQRDGICHELHVPGRFSGKVSREAETIARQVAESVGSTGLLAVEFFVVEGQVLVNELAPRPHNSGHWTIEGAETSQFEQHLRAVLGWPLGDTCPVAPAVVTMNLLGPDDGIDPFTRIPAALRAGAGHIHWYGKESRPGRKIGHVTARAARPEMARREAHAVWNVLMYGDEASKR